MKKFYETLRASFNPVTFKHYEKVKVFEKLEDAIAYAKRYSRDCGKCHFTDMLIYECTPRPDVYEVDTFSADMLRSSDECKQIYVATCCDGVLRACNTEAEQTSESSESEEADTAHASSTLYKGSDGKLYSVQEASYMAEGLRSWFACRCYHDAIYGKGWCKLHLVPFYNPSIALDYLKKYALRNKIQLTKQTSKTDEAEQEQKQKQKQKQKKGTVAESAEGYAEPEKTEKSDAPKIDESYDMGYGTTMYAGDEYILLEEPFMDDNCFGDAAYFAYAVKIGDYFDKDGNVKCYKLEFEIISPNWEGEGKEACDWYEASNVEFWNYVYYNYRSKQFIY